MRRVARGQIDTQYFADVVGMSKVAFEERLEQMRERYPGFWFEARDNLEVPVVIVDAEGVPIPMLEDASGSEDES